MEIHFCDLCNESVPQSDLDAGRAFVRKGRVVCAACDRAMGGHEEGADAPDSLGSAPAPGQTRPAAAPAQVAAALAPEAVPRSGGGAGGVLVGMLALLFAAAGLAVVVERMDGIADRADGASLELRRELEGVRRGQDVLIQSLDARLVTSEERIHAARDASRAELEGGLGELRTELQATGERFELLAKEIGGLRQQALEADANTEERVRLLGAQLLGIETDIRFYSDRMIEMEETLRGMSTRSLVPSAPVGASGTAPGASGPGASGGATAAAPAWQDLLHELKHANAGIRLDAVYALGETRDRLVIPYLIPMLQDVDLFVRMATARVLEDLEAKTGVPALIDALEDPSSAVREAAMVALRHITGHDFRFDPTEPSEAKRAKAVKAWRDWWKKSGDDFLTGSTD